MRIECSLSMLKLFSRGWCRLVLFHKDAYTCSPAFAGFSESWQQRSNPSRVICSIDYVELKIAIRVDCVNIHNRSQRRHQHDRYSIVVFRETPAQNLPPLIPTTINDTLEAWTSLTQPLSLNAVCQPVLSFDTRRLKERLWFGLCNQLDLESGGQYGSVKADILDYCVSVACQEKTGLVIVIPIDRHTSIS